ncbi:MULTISPECIES: hypothetical protein, partial [Pseudomonas syringae group genomosp. 2]
MRFFKRIVHLFGFRPVGFLVLLELGKCFVAFSANLRLTAFFLGLLCGRVTCLYQKLEFVLKNARGREYQFF